MSVLFHENIHGVESSWGMVSLFGIIPQKQINYEYSQDSSCSCVALGRSFILVPAIKSFDIIYSQQCVWNLYFMQTYLPTSQKTCKYMIFHWQYQQNWDKMCRVCAVGISDYQFHFLSTLFLWSVFVSCAGSMRAGLTRAWTFSGC